MGSKSNILIGLGAGGLLGYLIGHFAPPIALHNAPYRFSINNNVFTNPNSIYEFTGDSLTVSIVSDVQTSISGFLYVGIDCRSAFTPDIVSSELSIDNDDDILSALISPNTAINIALNLVYRQTAPIWHNMLYAYDSTCPAGTFGIALHLIRHQA